MNSIKNVLLKISTAIHNPGDIMLYLSRNGFMKWMPDDIYLRVVYRFKFHKKLNLGNPRTFTEKIQWLKLYDHQPRYCTMVDKFAAKEYVASIIGNEYIIPTIGVWKKAEDIDFDSLPKQFVLKVNHDSGGVVICKDKDKLDKRETIEKLSRCLKNNGYWYGREWPYKDIKPCIIAEQYMEDNRHRELRDYKFFCFGGVAKCFKVDFDRFSNHHANYYSIDGELFNFGELHFPPDPNKVIELPDSIKDMEMLAAKLSKNLPFLRTDFYDVNGKVYFGELTFYPASGFGPFTSSEADLKLGEWIKIPDCKLLHGGVLHKK